MIEVISAATPRFIESDKSVIVLNVQFSHLPAPVEFAASAHDTELHGRDIHARALAGEFGSVAEYAPPTAYEVAAKESPRRLAGEQRYATEQASHAWMLGDTATADAWKAYYQELVALPKMKSWPLVAWPERPE